MGLGPNAELVLRLYEAWNGKDPVQDVLPLLHPEFEWVNPRYAIEPGTRRGHEGWRDVNAKTAEAFESYAHEPGEVLESGDKILCFATFRARGRGSGVVCEQPEPHVWTMRDGKVVRLQWFHDEAEALRAVGLRPRDAAAG